MLEDFEMIDAPGIGRSFSMTDRVRLNDSSPEGHLRLDALVRYSQTLSNDDTNDSGLEEDLAWIARSTVIDVLRPAAVDEPLELTTFCGGLGRTWAERRVSVHGTSGPCYEVATLWVSIEPTELRPRRLSEQFLEIYSPSAQGRKVSAKQRISRPSEALMATGERLQWTPRWTDYDRFGHMNNVVYWSAIQHALGVSAGGGTRLLIEHGAGVQPEDHTEMVVDRSDGRIRLWWLGLDSTGQLSNQYRAAAEVLLPSA